MSTRRTTSTDVKDPAISEVKMRDYLAEYVQARCEIDAIEASAKTKVEEIKKQSADATKPWQDTLDHAESIVKAWALANPERFEKTRKIEVYGGHMIGFHTGQPTVVLVRPAGDRKKQTWEGFLEKCREYGKAAARFVRTKEEPNKEEIIAFKADADAAGGEVILCKLGVAVEQKERFVINLNLQPERIALAPADTRHR